MNNLLGQPTFSFDKSIHEYDVSVGRLQPQKIPDSVYRKLNIDRTPSVPLPSVDLGALDRRLKFKMEKDKLDNYYTKQPQLLKLPTDTRISPFQLAIKGKTLYDIYNKIQWEQNKQEREEEEDPSLIPLSTEDPGDFPEILFDEPEPPPSEFEFEYTPFDVPPGMPRLDDDFPEGKHDDTKPEAPSRQAPSRPERLDPTLREIQQPSISVIQQEVKIPSGERVQRLPEQKLPEAETFESILIGETPTIADIYFEKERPHISVPTWRPIQAIDQYGESFFIPSVVGEDRLEPSLVAPERQVMADDEPVMIHY